MSMGVIGSGGVMAQIGLIIVGLAIFAIWFMLKDSMPDLMGEGFKYSIWAIIIGAVAMAFAQDHMMLASYVIVVAVIIAGVAIWDGLIDF